MAIGAWLPELRIRTASSGAARRSCQRVKSLAHAIVGGAGAQEPLGDIAEGCDLEPVGELAQVMEVHHLGDEAASDDPYPKPLGHDDALAVERSNRR